MSNHALAYQIDVDGYFVQPVYADADTPDVVRTPPPQGLFRPRWNGSAWEEGDTAAALQARRAIKTGRVNQVRDQRLANTFTFQGREFQSSGRSKEHIIGGAVLALLDRLVTLLDDIVAGRPVNMTPYVALRDNIRTQFGNPSGFSINWIDADNRPITLNDVQMIRLGITLASHIAPKMYGARTKKDEVLDSDDPDSIDEGDW